MRENHIIQIQSMQLNMQMEKRIRLILMQRNLQDTLTWWRSFRKEKPPTFVCVCVCVFVTEWAEDISECFFHPHHLSKSTLWSSSSQIVSITFSNLLGNTQACKVLFAFHGILCSTTVGRWSQLPALWLSKYESSDMHYFPSSSTRHTSSSPSRLLEVPLRFKGC